MTAPLTERLEAYAQMVEVALPYAHPGAALLREAKAALEAHDAEIEAYTALLEAAEARVAALTEALELLLALPVVRALNRDAFGVPSNVGPYQLARDALAGAKDERKDE